MKSLFLIFSMIMGVSAAHAETLSCKKVRTDGEWLYHIENSKGEHVGEVDLSGYFEDASECQYVVDRSRNNSVCIYGKGQWRLFDTINKKSLFTQSSKDVCVDAGLYSGPQYLCYKNNDMQDWTLYSYAKEDSVSQAYESAKQCGEIASTIISHDILCITKEQATYAYKFSTWSIATVIPFSGIRSCQAGIRNLKSGAALTQEDSTSKALEKTFGDGYNKKIGFTFKKCEDPQFNNHLSLSKDGKLVPGCLPDTLYSWGTQPKINWFSTNMGEGAWSKKLDRPLFATQSPVGSFGYGNIAMRIKLKPGLKSKIVDSNQACGKLSLEEAKNLILVRPFKASGIGGFTGLDYIICSPGPIESWSYGTRTHYDEIVRDWTWIKDNSSDDFESYIKRGTEDQVINFEIDFHKFSEELMRTNMIYHRQLIDLKIGKVFYAPGVEKNPTRHFSTKLPIYYNWNAQP